MKTYEGMETQIHSFLASALYGLSDWLHAQAALIQGNSTQYQFCRRPTGAISWSGCCEKEKYLLQLARIKP